MTKKTIFMSRASPKIIDTDVWSEEWGSTFDVPVAQATLAPMTVTVYRQRNISSTTDDSIFLVAVELENQQGAMLMRAFKISDESLYWTIRRILRGFGYSKRTLLRIALLVVQKLPPEEMSPIRSSSPLWTA